MAAAGDVPLGIVGGMAASVCAIPVCTPPATLGGKLARADVVDPEKPLAARTTTAWPTPCPTAAWAAGGKFGATAATACDNWAEIETPDAPPTAPPVENTELMNEATLPELWLLNSDWKLAKTPGDSGPFAVLIAAIRLATWALLDWAHAVDEPLPMLPRAATKIIAFQQRREICSRVRMCFLLLSGGSLYCALPIPTRDCD